MKRLRILLLQLAIQGLLCPGSLVSLAQGQDWISQLPAGEGREVLSTLCIRCHDLQRVVGQRRDREIWDQTVHSMLPPEEIEFLEEEVEILIDYLSVYLGPLVPAHESLQNDPELRNRYLKGEIRSIIDLNTAAPEELLRLPGVDATIAALIVDFRNTRGRFQSPEELRQIEGIDEILLESLGGMIEVR